MKDKNKSVKQQDGSYTDKLLAHSSQKGPWA